MRRCIAGRYGVLPGYENTSGGFGSINLNSDVQRTTNLEAVVEHPIAESPVLPYGMMVKSNHHQYPQLLTGADWAEICS